jgi:hypothetical protein
MLPAHDAACRIAADSELIGTDQRIAAVGDLEFEHGSRHDAPMKTHPSGPRGAALAIVLSLCGALAGCGGGGGGGGGGTVQPPMQEIGPAWWNFGRDAQHTAQGGVATQTLNRIVWRTPVDLAPQYSANGALLIHYGSPVITSRNTVLLPVKTGATGGFRFEARSGATGAQLWSADSDYVLPSHNWTPSFNLALTTGSRVYAPGAGGKIFFRDDVDSASGSTGTVVFYGADVYAAARAVFDATVIINTPLTVDTQGNVYFGFIATGANPAGLASGIARIGADGRGAWVAASAASGNPAFAKVAMNSAPAVSADLRTLYVAVNTNPIAGVRQTGALLALDSATLATQASTPLRDPATGVLAWISDDATSSPAVGPDGDVYYGVLESDAPAHNFRGWLLHFDAALSQARTPGSFGWDDTPSIVPAAMVPGYAGGSAYLVAAKYNNYGGAGSGDGKNRMAILDPNQTQADPISAVPAMREILTILGPTPDPGYPGGVKEWCINTVAVDPLTRSVLVNSEDGVLYRWDLPSNGFTERITLNSGIAESYTPTAIGPDGAIYAINNAVLFAVGR